MEFIFCSYPKISGTWNLIDFVNHNNKLWGDDTNVPNTKKLIASKLTFTLPSDIKI